MHDLGRLLLLRSANPIGITKTQTTSKQSEGTLRMYVDPNRNTEAGNLKWILPYCKPDLPRARPHQRRNVLGDLAELNHLVVRHIGRLIEHEMRLR